jgi:hypothetical protein
MLPFFLSHSAVWRSWRRKRKGTLLSPLSKHGGIMPSSLNSFRTQSVRPVWQDIDESGRNQRRFRRCSGGRKRSGERPRERRHDPTRFWAGLLSNCGRKKSVAMGLLESERRETGMVAGRKRLFLANCPHRTSNRFGPKKEK